MTSEELIDSFLSGEMGDVEFLELALEAGFEIALVEEILGKAREDF